jgi:hypothetical protein
MKRMTVDAFEFIRRFLLHILPDRFMKIRHYGLLCNRHRAAKLARCKELLAVKDDEPGKAETGETWQALLLRITGIDLSVCPVCGKGKMIALARLPPVCSRGPP